MTASSLSMEGIPVAISSARFVLMIPHVSKLPKTLFYFLQSALFWTNVLIFCTSTV